MIKKICPQCKAEFETKNKRKKYCTKQCANNSLKKELATLTCQQCGKEFKNRNKNTKFCSIQCNGKHNTKPLIIKHCEYCGKDFTTTNGNKSGRFCNKSCSAMWRIKTLGIPPKSEATIKRLSDSMKKSWEDDKFREAVHKRMTENNPSSNIETNRKIQETKRKNNSYSNNFTKSGNGKISPTELLVYDFMLENNFIYNYAIPTKLARLKYPEDKFSNNYKPDYFNLDLMLAVELDGETHKYTKEIDNKKEKCLNCLGVRVVRFNNDFINNNLEEFKEEILKLCQQS